MNSALLPTWDGRYVWAGPGCEFSVAPQATIWFQGHPISGAIAADRPSEAIETWAIRMEGPRPPQSSVRLIGYPYASQSEAERVLSDLVVLLNQPRDENFGLALDLGLRTQNRRAKALHIEPGSCTLPQDSWTVQLTGGQSVSLGLNSKGTQVSGSPFFVENDRVSKADMAAALAIVTHPSYTAGREVSA